MAFNLQPCRSLIPALKDVFPAKMFYTYKCASFMDSLVVQQVLDKLDLRSKYQPGKVDIIDCAPGYGLFSFMLNQELKPRNHILIEDKRRIVKSLTDVIDGLESRGCNTNMKLVTDTAYSWDVYNKIIDEDKLIQPTKQPYDKVHDELLVVANWSDETNESIIAQWIKCCGDRNWLMRYGKVRMILFTPLVTTQKFVALPGFLRRKRTGMKVSMFTDTKVMAITEPRTERHRDFDPRVMVRDQPVLLPKDCGGPNRDFAIIEMMPGKYTNDVIDDIEPYLLYLFWNQKQQLRERLSTMAPGASYLLKLLPDSILDKYPPDLVGEDLIELNKAYLKWPFRPSFEEMAQEAYLTVDDHV
ncbi:Mitochondrial transcription factor 1 [Candida viswanathii]|uniref:rRNA adenine N(6)-methyltransferase n=1 Tax=Candida viswanathii TaxID=5486 RepID=A0A367YPT9_9ASCO|nr:Mitochondrial transcription factor 1 [Candida viswanathii]